MVWFTLAALLLACGCSAKAGGVDYSAVAWSEESANYVVAARSMRQAAPQAMEMAAAFDDAAGNLSLSQTPESYLIDLSHRKLIKNADIRIRVENLEKADAAINDLMEQYGAYSSFTNVMENHLSYTIRVPSVFYDPFLAAMDGMGRILHRSENTEDVSLRYYDLEGRLATKQELLNTFRAYLGRANNIEEILSVEARIADLQNEIDGTGRELRMLANLVDYSTVSIFLSGPVSSEPFRGPTLPERIRELFMGFGRFLAAAAVFLIGLVVYGIPVLLMLVLLFWLLFGRIGLIKKLYRLAAGKKTDGVKSVKREDT